METIEIADGRQPVIWIHRAIFTYSLSWKAHLAYLSLTYYATENAPCRESIDALAARVGIGRTAFKDGLKELAQKKLIRVKQRRQQIANLAKQLPSEYTLLQIRPLPVPSAQPEA
jgi:hypothetical protein